MLDFINRVLVLSPHPDDGEVSAGGTISRFIDEGKEMYYTAFSYCEKSIPDYCPRDTLEKECFTATKELGIPHDNVHLFNFEVREFPRLRQEILDTMIVIGRDIHPDLVITPSSFDTHQDHQIIYQESIRAFKKMSSIWGMEHPWNNLSFRTDIFVELEEKDLDRKVRALKKYNSQSYRNYFEDTYIKACAFTRGTMIDQEYAEVFECIRESIRI